MTSLYRYATHFWLPLAAAFFCCSGVQAQQASPTPASSPEALQQEVKTLRQQVKILDERIDVLSERSRSNAPNKSNSPVNSTVNTGGVAILFGAFCALWAQNTKRNALLWFFFGAIFNVIAVAVLLYKNST
jgi:hypothetical protein